MPHPIHFLLSSRFRRHALPLLLCLASAAALRGQATTPTASRAADLQVGAGLTIARHDYEFAPPEDGVDISGATIWATFDFRPHLGIEANFRELTSHNADHLGERSYEIGPRYVWHFNRYNPYVRVSYGRGAFRLAATSLANPSSSRAKRRIPTRMVPAAHACGFWRKSQNGRMLA